jgi:hypothetical protein
VPCWPDIWEQTKRNLPIFAIYGSVICYLALVVLLLWAPKIKKRSLRIISRAIGVVAVVPGVVLLPAFFLGAALASGDPPPKTLIVRSNDGKEAELIYRGGFLGRDNTEIRLKQPGCCRHTTVFSHAGPSYFDDPKLNWLDNRHLVIAYHTRADDPQTCRHELADIVIMCEAIPWPDSRQSTELRPGVPTS